MPFLLVLGGWLIQLLLLGQQGIVSGDAVSLPAKLSVGLLELETAWLNAGGSALRGALGLVILIVILVALESISVLTCYRAALHTSLEIAIDIQRRLFKKSGSLAVEHGLSGQQEAMRGMLTMYIPQVRESIHQWFRVFPRHVVQAICLVFLAASIHLWITLFAFVCALVLWMLFHNLETIRRKKRPVLFERARAASEQLSYLCNTAPLLASIHDSADTNANFESHLNSYRQAQLHLADWVSWKSPTMLLTSGVFGAVLLVVFAIRFLDESSSLHFGEVSVLVVSVALTIASLFRIQRAYRKQRTSETAAEQLIEYLERPTMDRNDRNLQIPTEIRQGIVLDHVTIRDSSGQKLLEDVSATIPLGQLTAIIASEPVQSNALAELIFGFGRPASGRILIDGTDSTDIDPSAIRNFSLWVAFNGPILEGTVEENLWSGIDPDATVDIMGIAKRMRVSDAILNLPDGLSTLVSPNEDRLLPDSLFRLGLARGIVKHRSLIIAQEPRVKVKAATESETLDAIRQLKSDRTMLVVLPQRLSTLRAADQILVIKDHKLVARGTHAQLLEESEIYRHLNYLQFSPFAETKPADSQA